MRGILLVVILALSAFGCEGTKAEKGVAGASDCAERQNGTWQGGPMTVTYDFNAGKTTALVLRKEETKKLELQKCSADEAVILSGDKQILIQFKDADHIALSAAGKIPVQMTRMPAM